MKALNFAAGILLCIMLAMVWMITYTCEFRELVEAPWVEGYAVSIIPCGLLVATALIFHALGAANALHEEEEEKPSRVATTLRT